MVILLGQVLMYLLLCSSKGLIYQLMCWDQPFCPESFLDNSKMIQCGGRIQKHYAPTSDMTKSPTFYQPRHLLKNLNIMGYTQETSLLRCKQYCSSSMSSILDPCHSTMCLKTTTPMCYLQQSVREPYT